MLGDCTSGCEYNDSVFNLLFTRIIAMHMRCYNIILQNTCPRIKSAYLISQGGEGSARQCFHYSSMHVYMCKQLEASSPIGCSREASEASLPTCNIYKISFIHPLIVQTFQRSKFFVLLHKGGVLIKSSSFCSELYLPAM